MLTKPDIVTHSNKFDTRPIWPAIFFKEKNLQHSLFRIRYSEYRIANTEYRSVFRIPYSVQYSGISPNSEYCQDCVFIAEPSLKGNLMEKFRALELAKQYYQISKNIHLPGHLKEQFLRASSSVALNLSEGNAKVSEKEKLRFYEIAHGSFRESVTILDLENIDNSEIRVVADKLGANLFNLTRVMAARNSIRK